MRGHIRKRSKGSWALVLDIGLDDDGKRKQRWITVKGTKKGAEAKLAKPIGAENDGILVGPSKVTFAEWLDVWLEGAAERLRPGTRSVTEA